MSAWLPGNAPGRFPRAETFSGRPHGTRLRFRSGCRCLQCRLANAAEARAARARRKAGDWRGFVSARPAREHLLRLQRAGVGGRAVADACDVALSTINAIRQGRRRNVRAHIARRILGVDVAARADHAFVSARRTWRLVEELLAEGFTKRELARRLGINGKAPRLYFRRDRIRAVTAHKVERFYAQVME